MNASSREVLKEVRFGLLITESDRKKCMIRRSGCPETKRVPRRSKLVFGCNLGAIEANYFTQTQTEEREGKRDNQKGPKQQKKYQNVLNRKYVCMGMHEHVTYKSNCIMNSAQSNLTSTQVCNKVNTHLRMHETFL